MQVTLIADCAEYLCNTVAYMKYFIFFYISSIKIKFSCGKCSNNVNF